MKILKRCETIKAEVRYLVKCIKCGREKEMLSQNLTQSHGITHQACSQGYAKKYPKLYTTWNGLVSRIDNPNDSRYKDYGGRGLIHEFPYFIDFIDYMLPSYLELSTKANSINITLERIDNNVGYVKGNLKWATQREQSTNKRTTVVFKAYAPSGEIYLSKNAQIFAEKFGLDRSGINKVIKGKRKQYKGWIFKQMSEMCVEAIERISNKIV